VDFKESLCLDAVNDGSCTTAGIDSPTAEANPNTERKRREK
jgi:hypothetical protein